MSGKKRTGLGRGLSSLLSDAAAAAGEPPRSDAARRAPIDLIRPNPDQPRRRFPPREMDELTASVKEKGVLQPLLVRPDPDRPDGWIIIAGERRWRAAQAAGLHEAPIVPLDLDDAETLEVAIIENVQRADLNPMEEAEGYNQLIDRFGYAQANLAKKIGKSRPYVANALRLLTLPADVRELVADGRLSAGHARALVTAADPSALAKKVAAEGLSVRQTEALAKHVANAPVQRRSAPSKDADTKALEADLSAALDGLRVVISHGSAGKGELRIAYKSLDELDGLCRLLMR